LVLPLTKSGQFPEDELLVEEALVVAAGGGADVLVGGT
jgi:hypothetical protein